MTAAKTDAALKSSAPELQMKLGRAPFAAALIHAGQGWQTGEKRTEPRNVSIRRYRMLANPNLCNRFARFSTNRGAAMP
jgi:hypothetical protein